MVLDRELTVKGLQDTETFSSSAILPLDPDPVISMKPIQLDPPEHAKWRKMLASYFSVKRMPHLEARITERVGELLDEIGPKGHCDFVDRYRDALPQRDFPRDHRTADRGTRHLSRWETAALHPDPNIPPSRDAQFEIMMQVMGSLSAGDHPNGAPTPTQRRPTSSAMRRLGKLTANPSTTATSSSAVFCCFFAGLDTVTNELSIAMHHLATNPKDRAALAADPSKTPAAVEEFLRVFSIPQLARKVKHDTTFGGQELKAGDMVMFSLAAANRDPSATDCAREVMLDRAPAAALRLWGRSSSLSWLPSGTTGAHHLLEGVARAASRVRASHG